MMKRWISIFVSLLLLVSHMSLTIGTHFCGGQPVMSKIVFGDTYLGCGMKNQEAECDKTGSSNDPEPGLNKTPCCQNHYKTIVSDDFVREASQLKANLVFALTFLYANPDFEISRKSTERHYNHYSFPPLNRDVQLFFKVFLI